MEGLVATGNSISDMWRDAMWKCVRHGEDFMVKGGSYVGQIRKQLPIFCGVIASPWKRPLAPLMPPGFPPPSTEEKIEAYFERYIMSDRLEENEQYTYGTFIVGQLDEIIDKLNKAKGNTNQACMTIGAPEVVFLPDPPCLREVSFKVVNNELQMSVFFRSWDLVAGMPENLGGLQLLKEYVLDQLDFPCSDGPMICYSDGLHIYDQYFELVDALNVDKIQVGAEALKDKEDYIKEHGV
jgi:thymidylate synthase